jgi:hypothetical protein
MQILLPRSLSALASEVLTLPSSAPSELEWWPTVSGTPTPKPSSWRGWKTRPWAWHLFTSTFGGSTARAIEDWWISSLAASRANRTPRLVSGEDQETNGISGQTCDGSSEMSSLGPCSSKTCPVCSLPPQDAAYVAGLIDGEGYIGIMESHGYYAARADIGMAEVALPLLNWLHARFGGSVCQSRAESEKWAAAFRWSLHGKRAAAFCRCIAPLLRLKRRQAEIVSQPGLDGSMKEEIHRLNRKGPSRAAGGWLARLVGGKWIAPPTLFEASPSFLESWPTSGSMRSGCVFARPTLERPTAASESSCWPTPCAALQNDGESTASFSERQERLKEKGINGNGAGTPLTQAAKLWPTPTDTSKGGGKSRSGRRSTELLLPGAAQMWSTPSARDRKSDSPDQSPDHSPPLGRQVLRETGPASPKTAGRRLNPRFVEALMGLPQNWSLPCDTE